MHPHPTPPELTGIARLPLAILGVSPRFGLDPAELMRAALIDPLDFRDPDARVPFVKILRLWQTIAERQPDPVIGLRLGSAMTVRELGLVGYVMTHSSSLGEALRQLSRYCRIISEAVRIRLVESRQSVSLELQAHPALDVLRHPVNARLATVLAASREITGTDLTPVAVCLPFPRPRRTRDYARFFRCALRFDQPTTAMIFRREQMRLPVAAADPTLAGYLDELAVGKLRSLAEGQTLIGRVRQAMWSRLSTGTPTLRQIAADLAIGERSLQRRLQADGTSFARLLENLRREVATELLGDRRLAVYELAFLLGYSEPSAFNRAFRRWTGSSPSQYRAAVVRSSAAVGASGGTL